MNTSTPAGSDLEQILDTESFYKLTASDLGTGNASFKVRVFLGKKIIDDEPTEVLSIEMTDLLTKSIYQNYFDGDDIARMGSYVELEQVFGIVQSCFSGSQKGDESSKLKLEFGYIETQQVDEGKRNEEVNLSRKVMASSKRALKMKYSKLRKDAISGRSMVATVQFSSELFTEFFAFELYIQNEEDLPARLLNMMDDRKNDIDGLQAAIGKLTEENQLLQRQLAQLGKRMNAYEEGKERESGLKIAQFFSKNNPGKATYIQWNGTSFDVLGPQYYRFQDDWRKVIIVKRGFYDVKATIYINCSNTCSLSLYLNGPPVFYAYGGTSSGSCHNSPYINQVMKLKKGDCLQFYLSHNGTAYAGRQNNFFQLQFLEGY